MMQVIGQRLTVVWLFECELWGKLWISLLVGLSNLAAKLLSPVFDRDSLSRSPFTYVVARV